MVARAPIKHYAIYEHPLDHPDGYVVREWIITPSDTTPGSRQAAASLEAARALLPPGLRKISDRDDPDPTIVEVWM